jgi:hypothetical protein
MGVTSPHFAFGRGIIRDALNIADTADGGLDASLGQALSVTNAEVLGATIRMMCQAGLPGGAAITQRLLACVGHERGPRRARCSPADDAPGKDGNDEGDIDTAARTP